MEILCKDSTKQRQYFGPNEDGGLVTVRSPRHLQIVDDFDVSPSHGFNDVGIL